MTEKEKNTINRILENKIIAIIRDVQEQYIEDVAQALYRGGIRLVEIAFNQSDRSYDKGIQRQIMILKEKFGDKISVGAGTVMTKEQVDMVVEYVDYIISPHTDVDIIRHTKELGLVSIPGAYTASEIALAKRTGADIIKLFPASIGTEAYIKAVTAPLSNVKLLAVGGVDESNIRKFIEAGCVGVGVGGKLVSRQKAAAGKFDEIEETARRLVSSVN